VFTKHALRWVLGVGVNKSDQESKELITNTNPQTPWRNLLDQEVFRLLGETNTARPNTTVPIANDAIPAWKKTAQCAYYPSTNREVKLAYHNAQANARKQIKGRGNH